MATSRVTARIDRSSHAFPPGEAFEPYLAIRTMPLAFLLAACGGAPFSVSEQVSALDVAGDAGPSSDEPGQVAEQVTDPPDAAPVPQQDAQAASHIDAGDEPDVAPEAAPPPADHPEASTHPGGCSAATCGGCCDSNSVCQGGTTNANCGTSGQLCNNCSAWAQSCNVGACVGPAPAPTDAQALCPIICNQSSDCVVGACIVRPGAFYRMVCGCTPAGLCDSAHMVVDPDAGTCGS